MTMGCHSSSVLHRHVEGEKRLVALVPVIIRWDRLERHAVALGDARTREEASEAAQTAVRETLEAFRDRPNRLGRARMFGERTIVLDDPGMLAFSRLLIAVAA